MKKFFLISILCLLMSAKVMAQSLVISATTVEIISRVLYTTTQFGVPYVINTFPKVQDKYLAPVDITQDSLIKGIPSYDFRTDKRYLRCVYKGKYFWGIHKKDLGYKKNILTRKTVENIQYKYSFIHGRWGRASFVTADDDQKTTNQLVFLTTDSYEKLVKRCHNGYEYYFGKNIPEDGKVYPMGFGYLQYYPLIYLTRASDRHEVLIEETNYANAFYNDFDFEKLSQHKSSMKSNQEIFDDSQKDAQTYGENLKKFGKSAKESLETGKQFGAEIGGMTGNIEVPNPLDLMKKKNSSAESKDSTKPSEVK